MKSVLIVSALPLLLCWGSFLNAFAFRLLHNVSIIHPRSYCPHCKHTLAWYDLIPLFSWIWLKGMCRYCRQAISWLYPFIEVFTVCSLALLLLYAHPLYVAGYFLFFSALIISIRTDLDEMLISRYATLYVTPFGFLLSMAGLLPITITESILGALIGYGFLYTIARLFYGFTKKEGLGQGDMDLLALIGSFTGIYGCWITLLIGSMVGSLVGIVYLLIAKKSVTQERIPFGPFLAIGAMSFVIGQSWLLKVMLELNA